MSRRHEEPGGDPRELAEPMGIELRPLLLGIAALVLGIVLGALAVFGLLSFWSKGRVSTPLVPLDVAALQSGVPAPRLQTDRRSDLERYEASQDSLLDTYGWVDRRAGTLRIPIARAMELTAAAAATRGGSTPPSSARPGGSP